MPFTFVDLFAGIGGFHAALSALGGECWFASDIDIAARTVYQRNWGIDVAGDIVPLTEGPTVDVPPHDVLAAGFPCQPFSKSGYQRGMEEARGTLFFNICRVLEEQKPPVVFLENVRNLAGPRQKDTWDTIIRMLRDLGYRVPARPMVFSPHLLPPDLGGTPQVRERVFILGTHVGLERAWAESNVAPVLANAPVGDWDPLRWDIETDLPLDDDTAISDLDRYLLSDAEVRWIDVWNEFLQGLADEKLPGFPIWADAFTWPAVVPEGTPTWKAKFLRHNADLYRRNQLMIDAWLDRHDGLRDIPPSRRKLEWQAQDTERDLWKTVLHLRPSGIRAKRPTYLPALVAITQTSIYGPRRRRITPREAARLQGLPEWFDFGGQGDALTYKQLGNGVAVGAVYHALRAHILRDAADLPPHVVAAASEAAPFPVIAERSGARPVDTSLRQVDAGAGERGVLRRKDVRPQEDNELPLVHR